VSELDPYVIIGIDLAGKQENPTGWAVWKNKTVKTNLLYADRQILEGIIHNKPEFIAIDAPFRLPEKGILREADRKMIDSGFRVFPPGLKAMKMLTERAVKLNMLIREKGFKTIEVHPTSTCKALSLPVKDWRKIQTALIQIGLGGDLEERALASHEIDAVLAALTAHLYARNETRAVGREEEGYIIVPKKRHWRRLKL
jgi:predicted nuclease with RNAse H fold